MNAVAPQSAVTPQVAQIANGTVKQVPASDLPETVAGTVREYTGFTVGEILEVKGAKLKVHDVTDQRLVLKFVHKQR